MDHLQKGDEMRNLDTIARLQLDDHAASLRRHLADRTFIRSMQRARSAPAQIEAQPNDCEPSAARRTAAQRPTS
jgi:hypothetical protein